MPLFKVICSSCSPRHPDDPDLLAMVEVFAKGSVAVAQLNVNKICPDCAHEAKMAAAAAGGIPHIVPTIEHIFPPTVNTTGPTVTKPIKTPFGNFTSKSEYEREKAALEAETGVTLREINEHDHKNIGIAATEKQHRAAKRHGFGNLEKFHGFKQELQREAIETGELRHKHSDAAGHASKEKFGYDTRTVFGDGTKEVFDSLGNSWYDLRARDHSGRAGLATTSGTGGTPVSKENYRRQTTGRIIKGE